ncbi:YkvA family protein [Solibacillus sp. FSL H8-0538]|uniref:YkvA family protein n=1 Tax=Solibacillus sp. FSL H8-0538 TaxID=2921400 RepID=UPI0030F68D45
MKEDMNMDNMIRGKDKHYSDGKFLSKLQKYGVGLGFKTMHAATTLYYGLKSPDMPKQNKLVVLGALGYFIFPLDIVADLLPVVGLTDDVFVITAALAKVYGSITDDMKDDAHRLLKKHLVITIHMK